MSEYNKALCDERQVNRNKEIGEIKDIIGTHSTQISELSEAVLTLTTLAKNERIWKFVVIGLTAVIVALALGKEIAAAVVAGMIGG